MKNEVLTRKQLYIMAVTAGVCVANIYYNQPILKEMGATVGASEGQTGLISVLSQAGYGLGIFFIIPLGDRMNRKRLILFLQAGLILVLLGLSVNSSLTGIYIMSLLVGLFGIAAQVILPMAASLDPANRGRNVGVIFTGILIGVLAARVLSGYIAQWLGWQYVYGISAVLVFISGIIFQLSLPNVTQTFTGNYLALLRSIFFQIKRFELLRRTAVLGALVFGAFCSFWTTLTFHLSDPPFNYHTDTIGLFGLLAIGGALLAPLFGALADKGHPVRSQLLTVSMIIIGVVLIKIFPFSLAAFIMAVLLLDVGVQATQVMNIATIYTLDPSAHSRINTVYMTTYFIGGSVGTFAGVQCWKAGGWSLVTWQLLVWGIAAFLVAVNGYRKR